MSSGIIYGKKMKKLPTFSINIVIMTNQFITTLTTMDSLPPLSNTMIKQEKQAHEQAILHEAAQSLIDLHNNKNATIQRWIQSLQLRPDIIQASRLGQGICLVRQTRTGPDYEYHMRQFTKEFASCIKSSADASELQRIASQLELFCYEYMRTSSCSQVQAWNLMQRITQQMSAL